MMKKRIAAMVLITTLTASQTIRSYGADSPGIGPVIGDNSGDSEYDIREWVDSVTGGGSISGSSPVTGSGQGTNTIGIGIGQTAGETTVTTNSRGQAVAGNTAPEFMQGGGNAVVGLPEVVVNAINGINDNQSLDQAVPGVGLTGYNALAETHVTVTKDAVTDTGEVGLVGIPLHVPNLVDGLGEVQAPPYNSPTGTWTLIQPNRIDTASKMLWFNILNPGIFPVIYRRQGPAQRHKGGL